MYICEQVQPVSRTLQYRKVMKPLLERKRRARINKCLDELKELMVSALVTDGDNASKMEKADILELTVAHLHKLRRNRSGDPPTDRFKAGFTDCANEVSKCLASVPGVDVYLGMKLMSHLGQNLKEIDRAAVAGSTFYTPPPSPCPEDFRCCFSTESSGPTFWRPW